MTDLLSDIELYHGFWISAAWLDLQLGTGDHSGTVIKLSSLGGYVWTSYSGLTFELTGESDSIQINANNTAVNVSGGGYGEVDIAGNSNTVVVKGDDTVTLGWFTGNYNSFSAKSARLLGGTATNGTLNFYGDIQGYFCGDNIRLTQVAPDQTDKRNNTEGHLPDQQLCKP
jgi:hypothetical protein